MANPSECSNNNSISLSETEKKGKNHLYKGPLRQNQEDEGYNQLFAVQN